jgi:hypothetical protein
LAREVKELTEVMEFQAESGPGLCTNRAQIVAIGWELCAVHAHAGHTGAPIDEPIVPPERHSGVAMRKIFTLKETEPLELIV